ncbi:prepilin-type N-terminal cleavage/methylation domain-containing protein [Bradyrhizobium lablabi]|uniref:prepilin-type N-terminal cleavage/methylation domain-containing protein n=1 Tax=Bradyrhizobium lablabi TaxID=722472 RepID=UPI001BA99BED|nr:prepilin-type N-terminal cleavage/methylation domain-containing protein [Bradyrhizobium lablabi]MBR0697765.1 prepilin-type N-terminal cleavage/methylation domain-containing protein [Bradyrhizobium lablabi]
MRTRARDVRGSPLARRRREELGLTLIELLLSIALLAILTGFLAGGLSMGRRAFDADRTSATDGEAYAAIQTLSNLIGSALPVHGSETAQKGAIMFEGRRDALAFVGLSEGRALPGGPHRIDLRQDGNEFVAGFRAWPAASAGKADRDAQPNRVAVLRGIRSVRLSYFGSPAPTGPAGWYDGWAQAEQLPDLVSIKIEFEDERRNEPATIVALRQG